MQRTLLISLLLTSLIQPVAAQYIPNEKNDACARYLFHFRQNMTQLQVELDQGPGVKVIEEKWTQKQLSLRQAAADWAAIYNMHCKQ